MKAFRTPDQNREEFLDLLRMWPTVLVALFTATLVYVYAPQQVPILVYGVAKMTIAGYVGYWLDRWIFPLDRPKAPDEDNVADDPTATQYRRAAIVCAALIASGLLS